MIGHVNKKRVKKRSWQAVKIKGNIISNDTPGLEGLIGLEVLEKYDKNLVSKPKRPKKPLKKNTKISKRSKQDDDLKKQTKETKPNIKRKRTIKKNYVSLNQASKHNDLAENGPIVETPTQLLTPEELEIWKNFGIPDKILKAISEKGFNVPTEIQTLAIPPAINEKKDILGAAETGSGKTLAFAIPILVGILNLKEKSKNEKQSPKVVTKKTKYANISPYNVESNCEKSEKPLYAVIFTPTRELAVQVANHIKAIATYTDIKVACIFGGMAAVKQERLLKESPEIVVATPGRLWELIEEGNQHLNKIDNINYLVIDETDRMVERGHFEEMKKLMNRINIDEIKKKNRQNFVFSATLTLVHDLPEHLQRKNIGRKLKIVKTTPGLKIQNMIEEFGISRPKVIDITRSNRTAENLTEGRLICPFLFKDYYLYYFLQMHPGRTIVFCNSIECVKRLGNLFGILKCQPLCLHANLIQKQRLKNLELFRDRSNGLLLATDVAARGLDIPNVQHVIHYQVPRTSENYVHRSGRTARGKKSGITVMLLEPEEIRSYLRLCKTLDRKDDIPIFPVSEKHLTLAVERVKLARDIDQLELKLKRSRDTVGWIKKNAKEMDIVVDSDDDISNDIIENDSMIIEKAKEKRLLKLRRQQLALLLNEPMIPKVYNYRYPMDASNLEIERQTDSKNSAVIAMKEQIKKSALEKKRRIKKRKQVKFIK